jgi:hypothetical protein
MCSVQVICTGGLLLNITYTFILCMAYIVGVYNNTMYTLTDVLDYIIIASAFFSLYFFLVCMHAHVNIYIQMLACIASVLSNFFPFFVVLYIYVSCATFFSYHFSCFRLCLRRARVALSVPTPYPWYQYSRRQLTGKRNLAKVENVRISDAIPAWLLSRFDLNSETARIVAGV